MLVLIALTIVLIVAIRSLYVAAGRKVGFRIGLTACTNPAARGAFAALLCLVALVALWVGVALSRGLL